MNTQNTNTPADSPAENAVTGADIAKILQLLPHRFPFLLVDRVLSYKKNESIRALKNVSINEPFFPGHFPIKPVMPGVLLLESLAQAAALLVFLSEDDASSAVLQNSLFYFAGIDNARFKRVVEPGDQLILEVKIERMKANIGKFSAKASVNGELCAEADLMCALKRIS